ncbi:hypothetical protein QO010_000175 [Caulobacter ginsengisoli]|uniref:Phosphatidylserine decarboxylase n=1 Tax=Caulobacter ginsengisoli TaxID=400775 RepID=A0ABU0IKB2_9CAUL|nr:DUF1254 domain-containing protein [Caulobacter ginsengisoli]MDQ0462427.1 hypothetical protein [Caulobacter ginsengisoli]
MDRRELLIGSGAGLLALALARPSFASPGVDEATARNAWLYALPLIEMATTRARHMKQGLPINRLFHTRKLADHTARTVTNPNNDTLYSISWLDLTTGPVILTIPPMGDRYYSAAVMDMFSNNNAVLGSRTVGREGGTFTLCGPGQASSGERPVRVATPHAWLLLRTLVDGPEDLDAAHAAQDGFKLAGPQGAPPPAYAGRDADPAAYFQAARELLAADPPPASDLRALRSFGALLGQGERQIDPAVLAQGVANARAIVAGAKGRQVFVDGWSYPRANLGDFGQDYLYRAIVAMQGLAALPVAEAAYLRPQGEADGIFKGDGLYRLNMPGNLPLDGFWSLSMYEAMPDGQGFFTDNPLGRYAIGDRTKGLKRNPDGSADIWIGRGDPGGDRTANWLPAPKSGPFFLTMRAYLPRPELLDGRWRMPPIKPA